MDYNVLIFLIPKFKNSEFKKLLDVSLITSSALFNSDSLATSY